MALTPAVILIPLDSGKNSEYAFDYYIQYIHRPGHKVYACYIVESYGDMDIMEGPSPGHVQEIVGEAKKQADLVEAAVTKAFTDKNVDGTFSKLRGKETWEKIVEHSKSINANMIVMGSRGLGKVKGTLLGSVSEDVLHHSGVPVLICKHPEERRKSSSSSN